MMPRPREILSGRRDRFAVKLTFLPDPDDGRAATAEESLAWGGLEIWVKGHNLCEHVEIREPSPAVHWYLLSFLQWLAANWDFLLHENRFPVPNARDDTRDTALRTSNPIPKL